MVASEDETAARFWARVDKRGPDECWPWIGNTNRNGSTRPAYGQLIIGGKTRGAHQLALELDGRERPTSRHCARHRCNNSICVNPAHLQWGEPWENYADAVKAGTLKRVLTDDQADAIRKDPRKNNSHVAADYGVSQSVVSQIRRGKTYKYRVDLATVTQ